MDGIIDMPLERLRQYMGINERPEDFDQYWDDGIHEMEALGTDYELVRADFQVAEAECYEMYFIGIGGARIHCRLIRPSKPHEPLPAVCSFHAYGTNSGDFSDKLKWTAVNCIFASMDCRGQNGKSEDCIPVLGNTLNGHIIRGLDDPDKRKMYYRNVFLDAAQLVRILMAMDDVDETKVGVYGSSQGGGIALACAALTPALNSVSACMPFLSDFRRVCEMGRDAEAYAELRSYFRYFDPLHVREKEIFTRLGYIDIQHLASRIQANVLVLTGLMDYKCPPSTQFAAFNKITAPKRHILYPDFEHEGYPGGDDMIMQFMLQMKKPIG